jgi:hypothetical protein
MVGVSSLFGQLLNHVSRSLFGKLVIKHGAEKHAKGFASWTQFVAMLFCHMAKADSLREICHGLACCTGKVVHLGLDDLPKKSTLAYANMKRPAAMFEDLFWDLVKKFRAESGVGHRKSKFRFKNKLLSLDSTIISLCLSLYPWAEFRRNKGGVKLHVLMDHDDYMPVFLHISQGKLADVNVARQLHLNPGSIVVMDRGYHSFVLYDDWCEQGIYFVTRLKRNIKYKALKNRDVPQNTNVLKDQEIVLTSQWAKKQCPRRLRRVVVWDERNSKEVVLLTNHLDFGATTISSIYRERWEIELFFKTLKQNLKIKTFVGTSENAVRIQIWTALIALLLLKWLHFLSRASWSFSNLVVMVRLNLFTYRHLQDWLDDPYGTPPIIPDEEQLLIPLKCLGQNDTRRGGRPGRGKPVQVDGMR